MGRRGCEREWTYILHSTRPRSSSEMTQILWSKGPFDPFISHNFTCCKIILEKLDKTILNRSIENKNFILILVHQNVIDVFMIYLHMIELIHLVKFLHRRIFFHKYQA